MKTSVTTATRAAVQNILGLCILMFVSFSCLHAQEMPPHPVQSSISVYVDPSQGLAFGAFYQIGTGGTVTVDAGGSRTSSGNVILANLGYSYSPVLFQVTASYGTTIQILNGPDVLLSGSNGGSMNLHLGRSDVGSPFTTRTTPPARTQVRIGGTLTIGSSVSNPPGTYNGTFNVTFIQQ